MKEREKDKRERERERKRERESERKREREKESKTFFVNFLKFDCYMWVNFSWGPNFLSVISELLLYQRLL